MHGVVKSSAGFEDGQNGWWKGAVLKQKDKGQIGGAAQELPSGDWKCQSYNCDGAINFKKNEKCYKCGAAKRW